MKNLQQITSFLLLAELKTFHKVADKLHLSTTAISKQIRALEQSLGEQLFIRTTRKVELTEFGDSFRQHCQELADKMAQVEDFVQAKKGLPQGKLKIVCALTMGKDLLLAHLPEFCAHYPHIELNIEFVENTQGIQFQQGDIHFAYSQHAGVTDDMRARKLFDLKHVLCATPGYLEKHPPIHSTADLRDHQFLNLNVRKPIDGITLRTGKVIPIAPPYLILNSFDALLKCCLAGMGVLLTADIHAGPYLKSGQLQAILPDLDYRIFDIYIFYRAMQYELPKVRAFVDFYCEKLTH